LGDIKKGGMGCENSIYADEEDEETECAPLREGGQKKGEK